jgi:glycosyltransferase involved in cell wall biosynthesis
MNVLFIHPSHPNQFTRIAHRLARRKGWRCAFLVDDRFTEAVRSEDPPIPYYGFQEQPVPEDLPLLARPLEEATRRGRAILECAARIHAETPFDAAVGHACFGTTFLLAPLLGVPVVSYVELPGHFTLYSRREFPPVYDHLLQDVPLRSLVYSSVLHSELAVVPSAHARSLFPEELRHKVRVRMEGFALPAPAPRRAALRRDLRLPEEAPVVGFTGRSLEAVRGFDVFLEAARRIRRIRPDARFLVLGNEQTLYGPESSHLGGRSFKQWALERAGLEEQEVIFRPFLPRGEFVRHLQAMDLALFPLFEGAGNWGIFEAMAAGLPVLASNRCFVPEVITHGVDGLLFDPEDAAAFARAALAILDDPDRFRPLGAEARRTVERRFSERAAAAGWAEVLREAVARAAERREGGRAAA